MGAITASPTTVAVVRRSSRSAVRNLAIGMIVILAAIGFLAYKGLTSALVYYITPSELLQRGQADIGVNLQLGGLVQKHSLHWDPTTHVVRFVLTDEKRSVPVVSSAVPPAMLRNGIGSVVQGTYNGHFFHATSILVKHDANYQAPKPGQSVPASDNYANK